MQISSLIKNNTLPVIKVNDIGLIICSTAFTAIAVGLPLVAHQFNLAGHIFLPMHLIVLVAGLLMGWRMGLVVGVLTPLISYSISGMPVLPILGQITLEVAAYGFFAGLLREKLKLNLIFALVLAMVLGRVVLGSTVMVLGSSGFFDQIIRVVKLGWPGILIQLAVVPMLVSVARNYLRNDIETYE